ncbi:glycerol-3-phosphate responsive antiterminator [Alkalibacillus haloalkaliphilus]|uniref:glycerol-3-phosphate responsive antiterminator n=1 Tax=Alkalibacillus haloalkaliphilus TaxID=94136 RepID=UPI000314E664|nr:glycerol-3-phosphate responsive antiterminator [Alkalibacillus haloalkaliphilus]
MLHNQRILPAVKQMKDYDKLLESDTEVIVLLETRISSLKSMVKYAKRANKKVIVHADLIQGLKTDNYGMEYLGQDVKPDGIISTRTNVIQLAKKYKLTAIQRMFLIDSQAIEHNLNLVEKTKPDFVEVLPGVIPHVISNIKSTLDEHNIKIIAGGLIRTQQDVDEAIQAGATAISTSLRELWDFNLA